MTTKLAFVIVGNEELLRARERASALTTIKARFGDDVSVMTCSGTELTISVAEQALSTDLLGGFPVLIVTEAAKTDPKTLKWLTETVSGSFEDAAVIVDVPKLADAGAKNVVKTLKEAGATVKEVAAPKDADKKRFAAEELRNANVKYESGADALLAEGENDLRGVSVRATQLAQDHNATRETPQFVTAEQVANVVTSSTVTGFALMDALVAKDAQRLTVATQNCLAAGAAPMLVLAWVAGTLRNLVNVKTGRTQKMSPYVAKKMVGPSKRWTDDGLARAFHELGVIQTTVLSSDKTQNYLVAALNRMVQ